MPATLNLAAFSATAPQRLADRRRISIRAVAVEAATARRPAGSLYEVLRVDQAASPTEIKSAYRSLAKVYHPDATVMRSPECDGGDFIQIRSAYETLSDPSARATYDTSLAAANGGRRRRFSSPLTMNRRAGSYPTRRWETDQCW